MIKTPKSKRELRYFMWLMTAILVLISCTQEKNEKPQNTFSEQERMFFGRWIEWKNTLKDTMLWEFKPNEVVIDGYYRHYKYTTDSISFGGYDFKIEHASKDTIRLRSTKETVELTKEQTQEV